MSTAENVSSPLPGTDTVSLIATSTLPYVPTKGAYDDTQSSLLSAFPNNDYPFKLGKVITSSPAITTVVPHKPLPDVRSYRFLQLPENGLRILLISDPKTDKSAAALQVNVGHLSDPVALPGLSHFLEHMLFLGTAKYPDEASYKKFLKDHGGGSNASTAGEATTYYFYVHKDHLEEAFDRFSSFFISPLFTESATDRELNAVDSENSKNLQDDGRRELQIKKHISHPERLYRKFGTGNMITLRTNPLKENIRVREALIEHYNTYYSANVMTLSILGKESLDTLEEWITGKGKFATNLAAIRNTNRLRPMDMAKEKEHYARNISSETAVSTNPTEGYHPYQFLQLNQSIYVKPVKDIRTLTLYWPVPLASNPNYSHSSSLVSHVLGYEGSGSLLSLFKQKGWANGLSAGCSNTRYFSLFSCSVTLTPTGLEHINEIVQYIFQYITLMVQSSSSTWEMIAKERQQVWSNTIRFQSQISPVNLVNTTAATLQWYPAIDSLVGDSLLGKFDYQELQRLLLCLWSPRNMYMYCAAQYWGTDKGREFIQQQLHAGEGTLETCTEPYYQFDYTRIPFSNHQLKFWGYSSEDSSKLLQDTLKQWNYDISDTPSIQNIVCEGNHWDIASSTVIPCAELRMPDMNEFVPSDFRLRIPSPRRLSVTDTEEGDIPHDTVPNSSPLVDENTSLTPAADNGSNLSNSTKISSSSPKDGPVNVNLRHSFDFPSLLNAVDGTETILNLSSTFTNPPTSVTKKFSEPVLLHPGSLLRWINTDGVQYKATENDFRNDITERLQTFSSVPFSSSVPSPSSSSSVHSLPVRLWMKQDTTFGLPKTFFQACIYLPRFKALNVPVCRHRAIAPLYTSVLNDLLNEITYNAQIAGLGYDIDFNITTNVFNFGVYGYSHKLPLLLQRIVENISSFATLPDDVLRPIFERRLEARKRSLANFSKARPDTRAVTHISEYLSYPFVNHDEALTVTETLTLTDLRTFATNLFDTCSDNPAYGANAEVLVYGNTDTADAQNLCATFVDSLRTTARTRAEIQHYTTEYQTTNLIHTYTEPLNPAAFLEVRGLLLAPRQTIMITRPHPNKDERNSAVSIHWQLGASTIRTRAIAELLSMVFSQPAFDTLRTKEQLGYIVQGGWTTSDNAGSVTSLYVTIQSSNASVEHLQARIENFIQQFFTERLQCMTNDDIQEKIKILMDRLTEPDKTQASEANRLWGCIGTEYYNFHYPESLATCVGTLTHNDLMEVYKQCILPEGAYVRKIIARVYAQPLESDGNVNAVSTESPSKDTIIHDGGPGKVPLLHPSFEVTMDQRDEFKQSMKVWSLGMEEKSTETGMRGTWLPPSRVLINMN